MYDCVGLISLTSGTLLLSTLSAIRVRISTHFLYKLPSTVQFTIIRDASGAVVGGCEQPVCQNVVLNISPGLLRYSFLHHKKYVQ